MGRMLTTHLMKMASSIISLCTHLHNINLLCVHRAAPHVNWDWARGGDVGRLRHKRIKSGSHTNNKDNVRDSSCQGFPLINITCPCPCPNCFIDRKLIIPLHLHSDMEGEREREGAREIHTQKRITRQSHGEEAEVFWLRSASRLVSIRERSPGTEMG